MTELSSDHIEHLSRLARIHLNEEEQTRFASQLSSVVNYVEQLSVVDTSSVEQLRGISGLKNVTATDTERVSGSQLDVDSATLLAGTPASEGRYIEVRAVLGEEVVGS